MFMVKIEGCTVAWLACLNCSEWRLLPWYISKQHLHHCLVRDREAGESDRAMYVLLPIQLSTMLEQDRPGFMGKTCFSPFKLYLHTSGKLFLAIFMLWKCIRAKSSYHSWSENWRMYLSPRIESFRYCLLLQQQLFRPHFFLSAAWSECCQTAQHIGLVTSN